MMEIERTCKQKKSGRNCRKWNERPGKILISKIQGWRKTDNVSLSIQCLYYQSIYWWWWTVAKENFVSMGMIADINIHNAKGNPHAHVMLTMRRLDREGWDSKKGREWNRRNLVFDALLNIIGFSFLSKASKSQHV